MRSRVVRGVDVLPAEEEVKARGLGIWLARHPAERDALVAHGILDVLSVAWEDCWREAAWDTTRRTSQLGLYLSEVCARLQEVGVRLDDAQAREDAEDFEDLQDAIRESEGQEFIDWSDVEVELDEQDRLDELEREAATGSPNWPTKDDLEQLPF